MQFQCPNQSSLPCLNYCSQLAYYAFLLWSHNWVVICFLPSLESSLFPKYLDSSFGFPRITPCSLLPQGVDCSFLPICTSRPISLPFCSPSFLNWHPFFYFLNTMKYFGSTLIAIRSINACNSCPHPLVDCHADEGDLHRQLHQQSNTILLLLEELQLLKAKVNQIEDEIETMR